MPDWQLAGKEPGDPYAAEVPAHLADDYAARDLDPAAHRRVYEELLDGGAAAYERVRTADGWVAYPDAAPTVAALRERGVPVGLISNMGLDLRPVLAGLGIAVDSVTLSYEHQAVKPDPALFVAAFAALGVEPPDCLVVGDDPDADVGGARLGAPTLLLPRTPPGVPHGLAAVLQLYS